MCPGARAPTCPPFATPLIFHVQSSKATPESLRKKLSARALLIRRLATTTLGAGASVLRTATLALVCSTAEYCAPVWCRSAHSRLIDPLLTTHYAL